MTISTSHPGVGLNDDPHGRGRVVRIGPDRQLEAVGRLLSVGGKVDRAHATRFLKFAASNRIPLDALWSYESPGGRLAATVLAVPSPGRTAMIFATQPNFAGQVADGADLLRHVCQELTQMDVNLAQALLDPSESFQQQAFERAGFQRLANLTYLERPLGRLHPSPAPQWPDSVSTVPYSPALEAEICSVLERTYVDTLDCPGLVGLRRTKDVLAGHRATGRFDPKLWTLLRIEGRAEGVLLMNPTPAQQSIELVYLGLSLQARGRGLGREMLLHGLGLLKGRSEKCISLAVDDRNLPALTLYEREGFRRALRRVAMIHPIR